MKNGLFTTISREKDRGAGHVNQLKRHQNWYSSKEGFVISLVGLQRNCLRVQKLLPSNRTINSVIYIEQLTKLNNAVEEKRPELTNRKVVFHHDNARPHTSLVTRQKLLELG